MSLLEIIAVVVSIAAVSLTIMRSAWCWVMNFIAVSIYALLFFEYKLYGEVVLQFVFMGMYIYGFIQWRKGLDHVHDQLEIQNIELKRALWQCGLASIVGLIFGSVLHFMTDAAVPFLDAQLAAFSMLATYWTSQKYIATWTMWVILDIIYVGMFAYKGLYLTALLYAGFVLLAAMGWWQWLHIRQQQHMKMTSL